LFLGESTTAMTTFAAGAAPAPSGEDVIKAIETAAQTVEEMQAKLKRSPFYCAPGEWLAVGVQVDRAIKEKLPPPPPGPFGPLVGLRYELDSGIAPDLMEVRRKAPEGSEKPYEVVRQIRIVHGAPPPIYLPYEPEYKPTDWARHYLWNSF
jgi:hypothetical protein